MKVAIAIVLGISIVSAVLGYWLALAPLESALIGIGLGYPVGAIAGCLIEV